MLHSWCSPSCRALHASLLPDPTAWLGHPHAYLREHWHLVAWFVAVEVALACAVAFAAACWLPGPAGHILQRTAWWHSFREVEPEKPKYVCVRLHNGAEYFGMVETYTPNTSAPDARELCLIQPGLAYRAKRTA